MWSDTSLWAHSKRMASLTMSHSRTPLHLRACVPPSLPQLADIEPSTSDPTPTPFTQHSRRPAPMSAEGEAGRGAGGARRANALSPSKQKRLHQLVRRFGRPSQTVFLVSLSLPLTLCVLMRVEAGR